MAELLAYEVADLFCGAGGTSTGAIEAVRGLGYAPKLTAVNHWAIAVETHSANHPDARHFCASLDSLNPRHLYGEGQLRGLLASPECMGHSIARGGRPVNDQSRATAWCVLRWADALLPDWVIVENVPEFEHWAPIGSGGRPLRSRRGEVFGAWITALESLGYRVSWRVLCAADYGDPTTRRRLFVQAVRGRRKLVWPEPTHGAPAGPSLFAPLKPYTPARAVIDWSVKGKSIFGRKRPLAEKTLRRIYEGAVRFWPAPFAEALKPFLIQFRGTEDRQVSTGARSLDEPLPTLTAGGGHLGLVEPILLAMEHGGRVMPSGLPLPTVTCAKGGAFALAEPFLIQTNHAGEERGRVRNAGIPLPTVCGNRGEWATVEPLVVSYYGAGEAQRLGRPLPTVTTHDRFGLMLPSLEINGHTARLDVLFRMLQPKELAGAQGFPPSYQFAGTKTQITKQIGNAVPRRLARALVAAVVSQKSDVSWLKDENEVAA